MEEAKLYYTAPSDEAFEDMRQAALKVWEQYKDDPEYYEEKTGRLKKDMQNVKDNFMYIFAMFDTNNQQKCVALLKEATKDALRDRLVDGGNGEYFINNLGV